MRLRNTLAALVLLAGLGAFIYFYEYKGEATRQEAERTEKSVLNVSRDAVVELTIARPGSDEMVLRKEKDQWMMHAPIQTRADGDRVDSLLSTLSLLQVEETLKEVTAEERGEFKLEPPAARVSTKIVSKDEGQPPADGPVLLVGEKVPMGGNHYAARPGSEEVLLVSGGLDSVLTADAASLRYKKVVGLDAWKVARFRIEGRSGALALSRSGDAWKIETPAAVPADGTRVQNLWFDVQAAEAEGFESEKPGPADRKRFGLDPPRLTLAVEATEGSEAIRVSFGEPDPNGPVYAQRSDVEAVMKVGRPLYERLSKALADPADLRDARVAPADRFKLSAVEVQRPGQPAIALHKDDASLWHWGAPSGPDVPSEQVNGVLDALEAAKATGWVDAQTAGTPDPVLTITLTEGAGEEKRTVTARLLPPSGQAGSPRRFATTASPSVYLVPPDLVKALEEKVAALKEPSPADQKKEGDAAGSLGTQEGAESSKEKPEIP